MTPLGYWLHRDGLNDPPIYIEGTYIVWGRVIFPGWQRRGCCRGERQDAVRRVHLGLQGEGAHLPKLPRRPSSWGTIRKQLSDWRMLHFQAFRSSKSLLLYIMLTFRRPILSLVIRISLDLLCTSLDFLQAVEKFLPLIVEREEEGNQECPVIVCDNFTFVYIKYKNVYSM